MFKIGDYVAHYKEGVCEVVNIGKIDMGRWNGIHTSR